MTQRTTLSLALSAFATLAAITSSPARAATDSLDLSLEELMNVVVTSVSKKSQTLAQTAAAAYVIQAEDIRRSGATTIPEALRLAPGVQVSAIGNNKWAVSIRGHAERFSNKLLVLVDGRSVYTPLFSGVFWEGLEVPLENIERIEVIRGAGASIWGANAVNGVINIITRSAFDTPGGKVALSTGTERRAYGFARYGWNPDPDTAVQLHAKAHDYDTSKRLDGGKAVDDWQNQSAGFKLERLLEKGTLQVQGGVFSSHAGDEVTMLGVNPMPFMTPTLSEQKIHGGHLMARWEFDQSKTGGKSLQVFVDQSDYQHVILNEKRLNLDLEYQQRWAAGSHHDLIWGLGYRRSSDRIGNSSMLVIDESKRTSQIFSAYLQDEITLQPERWRLSLGARLEHNQHTGLEFQPNARLLWTPTEKTSGWMSVARAVRTPSRIEQGATVYVQADPAGMPAYNVPPSIVATRVAGMQEEKLDAFDIGWRHQFNPTTSLDLAAFHYKYKELRGSALTTPSFMPPGYLLIVAPVNNAQSATTNGIEATLDWRPRSDWRLQASLSRLNVSVPNLPLPELASDVDKVSPTNQIGLRSSLDLSSTLKWDAWLRHVGRIEYYGVPAFTTLDMRLAWQATKNLEVALVGQNLLDKAHPEYGSQFITSPLAAIERSVYVKLDWKF